MKKSTYALIAFFSLPFLVALILMLVFSRGSSATVSIEEDGIYSLGRDTESHYPESFNRILLYDRDVYHGFYDENGVTTEKPALNIVVSDSVVAPEIVLPSGWEEVLTFSVSDSTLTIKFRNIHEQMHFPTPLTVCVPSLESVDLHNNIPTSISGKCDVLDVNFLDMLYFNNAEINNLTIRCKSEYSRTDIYTSDSKIQHFTINYVSNIMFTNHSEIEFLTIIGDEFQSDCDVELRGDMPSKISTVATKDRQHFEITTSGSHIFNIE